MEECCRGHRASAFLLDAPHATHAHMKKLQTFTALSKKHKQNVVACVWCVCVFFTESSRVWRECKYRGSIFVDCIYCCDMRVSWRPRASLRGLGS